ncbi:EamA family transporter [Schlesneria paludicola]|uniref:EamA family transporter n=1 Tax=Schlesneria paludicola TaxID=360056 RepID=UPI00029A60CA|nr:EamA family transporter [Schlesneria paludicola]
MTRTIWFPVALLMSAMISLQAGAAIAKQLLPSLGAAGTATLRLCFASLILCLVCRPWRERLSRRSLTVIGLYGLTLGSMNLFFCSALLSLPLGIAVALEFMGPLAVAVCSSRRKLDFLWITLAIAGVIILLPKADTGTALPWQGILYALCAAACWALYIVIGQKAGATAGSGTVASIGMLAAALAITPLGVMTTGSTLMNTQYWPTALAVAVLSSAVPYSLEMIALKAMPVRTFGILMSMEPAVASLSGMILLHEYLNGTQWLAVTCVMLASFGAVAFSNPSKAIPEAGV